MYLLEPHEVKAIAKGMKLAYDAYQATLESEGLDPSYYPLTDIVVTALDANCDPHGTFSWKEVRREPGNKEGS